MVIGHRIVIRAHFMNDTIASGPIAVLLSADH